MSSECKITEEGRECSLCHEFKIWDCYYKQKGKQIGYSSWCKACHRVYYHKTKPVLAKSNESIIQARIDKPSKIEKSGLMQVSHEVKYAELRTQKQIDYEKSWREDAIILEGPHPALYEHK